MSFIVTCNEGNGPYGPFDDWDEDEAHRYAGLLDIDPACDDTRHEVEWTDDAWVKPIPHDELLQAVTGRIERRAARNDVTSFDDLRGDLYDVSPESRARVQQQVERLRESLT